MTELRGDHIAEEPPRSSDLVTGDVVPPPRDYDLQDHEPRQLPPILQGAATPELASRVERFYSQIHEAFERWVERRESPHTQRAYRGDVLSFIRFFRLRWPEESWGLLRVAVVDVHRWRDHLIASGAAPKTINRRI